MSLVPPATIVQRLGCTVVGEANVPMSRPRNLAAIVLAVALALALGSSAVLAPEADAYVSRSALTLVAGSVLVSHDGSSFKPAHEGDVIAAGDTIRTESGAAAEITYFE